MAEPMTAAQTQPDGNEVLELRTYLRWGALERAECRAVVFTGGTGIAPRDVTPDSIEPLLDGVIPGFGEFFRQLSFE